MCAFMWFGVVISRSRTRISRLELAKTLEFSSYRLTHRLYASQRLIRQNTPNQTRNKQQNGETKNEPTWPDQVRPNILRDFRPKMYLPSLAIFVVELMKFGRTCPSGTACLAENPQIHTHLAFSYKYSAPFLICTCCKFARNALSRKPYVRNRLTSTKVASRRRYSTQGSTFDFSSTTNLFLQTFCF